MGVPKARGGGGRPIFSLTLIQVPAPLPGDLVVLGKCLGLSEPRFLPPPRRGVRAPIWQGCGSGEMKAHSGVFIHRNPKLLLQKGEPG